LVWIDAVEDERAQTLRGVGTRLPAQLTERERQ
jgi:hypothetical protein